ncbi:uncharacterized protein LOC134250115 [Saccostrea cucullata]|uniref:uncharacterized protein LOC134250115 n=1 Tax=Saccostrea cuccullata TaxID=36930 RepID=UPI002ED4F085
MADKKVTSNIPHNQYQAMQNLKSDQTIVIKSADKGGAIVIMDREHYKEMSLSQLQDNQFYKKLEQNTDRQTMLKIQKLTKKYQGNLTKNELEYLTDFEVKTSHFYGLPKIHKCKEIQENVNKCNSTYIKLLRPNDLKLRPIIAGPASSTQRLSNLLDIILKPLCTKVTSYVRDDMDFLNYIPQTVPRETLLVSFDVTSLYTNITHELGIEAIKYWWDKYPEEIDDRFPANFILEGLRIVLENNDFLFDDENYLQIKGTAMGTKVAPTYACLVMGFLEEKLYNVLPETFDLDFTQYIKENWKRYLDDCCIVNDIPELLESDIIFHCLQSTEVCFVYLWIDDPVFVTL